MAVYSGCLRANVHVESVFSDEVGLAAGRPPDPELLDSHVSALLDGSIDLRLEPRADGSVPVSGRVPWSGHGDSRSARRRSRGVRWKEMHIQGWRGRKVKNADAPARIFHARM